MRPRALWVGAAALCMVAAWFLLRPSPDPAGPRPPAPTQAEGEDGEAEQPFFVHANWDASAKAPASRRARARRNGAGGESTEEAWERLKGVEFVLPAPEEKR